MSITNNTTFDRLPTEIRVNRSSYFNNNPNASTISRQKLDSMIYSTGVDDYMFNEIKKAKYQGCFDPGSIGNKNMFNDSYNYKINTTETSSNTNDLKKTHDKAKKIIRTTSTNLHRHDEGKNLLIAKSETQYPYEFDRRHCVLSKKYNFRKNLKNLDYCYNSSHFSPINKIRRTHDSVKNKTLSHNNSNYFTPGYNDRKYRLQTVGNKYKNKTLMLNSLMDNYYNSSKALKYSRFNNSSYKKSSCSNLLSHKKNVCFSPIINSNPYIEYDSKTSNYKYANKINQKIYKSLNASKERNEDNNILFSQLNDYDYVYNINSNETEFDNETLNYRRGKELKAYKDINIHIGSENDTDKDDDNGNNMKLINKYMGKILSLFLTHMSNFYLLHFRDIFKTFISQLKKSLKNDEYHFENKTIKNIALIKKKIKSNPFYYGHNKQFQNLLKEQNRKNPNSTNKNKTKINSNIKIDIEKQAKINLIRKRYVLDNKKNKDKNRQIMQNQKNNNKNTGPKKLKVEIINKKYIKKKVSQRIIDKVRLQKIISQQNDNIRTNTENFGSDHFNENNQSEIKKLFKSFDENDIINDDEFISPSNVDKKLITPNNFSKVPNNKAKVNTLLFKKTTVINNAYKINKNINLKKKKRKLIIPKNNEDKKDLKIYGVSDILSQDEKLNMNMRYLEMDNKDLSLNTINNKNNKNFEIDNNFTHTIIGKLKNDNENKDDNNNDDENDHEIDTFSNRQLQNAISIISKIMESKEKNNIKTKENNNNDKNNDKNKEKNKEKDKEKDKINSLLKKIIEKKEKKNIEIIKKYFNKFKDNNRVSKKPIKIKKKYSLDLGENIDSNKSKNKLIESKLFNNQKEDSERNKKERRSLNDIGTSKESTSPNRRGSKFKVVIKKLKIHKSITKNIFNPKIKIRYSKKSIPSLTDNNSTSQRSSLNKINSMIININKNNLLNDTNKEQTKNEPKEEKKEESKSSIESDESSENSNLNINNEMSKKKVDTNSDKNLHRNIKIISKKRNNKDKRKSFAIPHKRSSIEMFTKYIKNKSKLNLSSESIHDGDTTLNEKYQDYENLIFYLRTQLIYCFISNKKNNDSCAD